VLTPLAAMGDDEWVEEAKTIFAKYDVNGDGHIDEEELAALLMAISDTFTEGDIKRLLKEADKDADNRVSYDEFIEWLTGGTKKSLGLATLHHSPALMLIFNVYDKERTGVITTKQFQECHVILQAAVRSVLDEDPEADHKNDALDEDKEESDKLISSKATDGTIGFMDFVEWMRHHIPDHMDQEDFYDFTESVAIEMQGTFQHDFQKEEGYEGDADGHILRSISRKLISTMEDMGVGRRASAVQMSPWDRPPSGLTIDRLKATHMMANPLNAKVVKDISWEILCMPSTSSGSEVWVAELVRRVLMTTGKLKTETATYYRYNLDKSDWERCSDPEVTDVFGGIQSGLGLFSLLKSACNFGPEIRWHEIETALEGGVDMRLISDDDLERYNEHMRELVLTQLEEDGCDKLGDTKESKAQYVERYLANELTVPPGMVMAALLKLEIVEKDASWEAFVEAN